MREAPNAEQKMALHALLVAALTTKVVGSAGTGLYRADLRARM
jgi:hypothetical protein